MNFAAPWMFLLSLPAAAACVFLFLAFERRATKMALTYSQLDFFASVAGDGARLARILRGVFIAGVLLLALAAGGPQVSLKLPSSDGAVVLCVDVSGSMASADVVPTRMQAAINALHAFVRQLGSSVEVGVVSFSSQAQASLQPTDDRQNISDAIDTLPKPNGATAIGDGLALSAQILPKTGRRAIILLTDGVNNRGDDPLAVAHELARNHVIVYTVGIGTNDSGQFVPNTNERASADPDALKEYADITGGTSVVAGDADAIVHAFSNLARNSAWETKRVDAASILAVLGGLLVTGGFLAGFGLGRYP